MFFCISLVVAAVMILQGPQIPLPTLFALLSQTAVSCVYALCPNSDIKYDKGIASCMVIVRAVWELPQKALRML